MSGSGLSKKLGLKAGMTVSVMAAPDTFAVLLSDLPDGVRFTTGDVRGANCVIAFVRNKADVRSAAEAALAAVKEDGLVWFGYPKKSGRLKTDITRDAGWEFIYEAGFDSVAQVSIDETWTGFRFREKRFIKVRPK